MHNQLVNDMFNGLIVESIQDLINDLTGNRN